MVISIMLAMLFSLLVFKNSLYYTMCLLLISIWTLSSLVAFSKVSTLTAFMVVIVYVGAMMILIGYICAISPNLIVEPDYSKMSFFLLLSLFSFFFSHYSSVSFSLTTLSLVDFFYTSQGLVLFFTLVFMLFMTLLMVTTQYMVPRGPFRSV